MDERIKKILGVVIKDNGAVLYDPESGCCNCCEATGNPRRQLHSVECIVTLAEGVLNPELSHRWYAPKG